jgi:tRNA A-37 threonylcarbamoyl transferase component Bud32
VRAPAGLQCAARSLSQSAAAPTSHARGDHLSYDSMSDQARSVIGGYRITDTVGAGGMGVVYLAEHEILKRKAALKVLLPEFSHDQVVVGRFFNEARASTAISHPGIVRVYDFGYQGDGSAFIAMEFLDGEALDHRLRRLGPMPVLPALRFAGQIANALAAAHGHGIVHRDLKPGNVFIVPDPQVPGGERTKLLDFGIAKFATPDAAGNHTRAGAIMGSPAYMAPEQCRGLPDVDPRADLYSVGCMLFEMLCGRPPFDGGGNGPMAIMSSHLHDPPPVPSAIRADVPPEVDALILYLLAKDPAQRYQTAADLGAALAAVSGEQVSFSSLPGVTAEHGAATWPSGVGVVSSAGVAVGPTGQPLSASQVATLRQTAGSQAGQVLGAGGATQRGTRTQVTPPRGRSIGLGLGLAAVVALAVAIAVAVSIAQEGGSPIPQVQLPTIAAPAPAAKKPPRKPALTFKQLGDDWKTAPTAAPRDGAVALAAAADAALIEGTTPGAVGGAPVVLSAAALPSFSFSFDSLFSGGLFRDVFTAFQVLATVPPRTVTWRLMSEPAGAQVLDGDQVIGTTATPLVVSFDETPEYQANLVLRLDGHDDATVALSGSQDFDQTITLVPRIPVRVESKPPGAAIVDASGQVLGTTPATITLSRSSEAAALILRLDGYEDLPLPVVPDRERKEKAALVKVRAIVTVHLESTPPGASILSDGALLGVTPFDHQFPEEKGSVSYTLRLDGYRDQKVKVAADQSTSKVVELKAKAAAKPKCATKPKDKPAGTRPALFDPYDRC